MSAPVRIRTAQREDLPAIVALEESFPSDRLSARQFAYLLGRAKAATFVAAVAGRVVGYATILLPERRRHARLYSLAVEAAMRGQGIGRRLIERAVKAARERGLSEVRLEVRAKNAGARGLYERCGFTFVVQLPGYYEDGADAVRYRRALPSPGAR